MAGRTREAPGRTRAAVYALLVHLAVIAFLVVSFRWSELDTSYVVKTGPHVIHAFMVGPRPALRPTPPIPQPRVAPPPPRPAVHKGPSKAQLAAQRARQKALREARAKAQAVARAQAAAKAKAEARAQTEARAQAVARAQALAKAKARAQAEARARAEQAARAAAHKRLKAQERAAAVRARAKLQREVAQAAARARQRAAARAAAAARGVVSRYKALIEARVSAAWVAVPQSKGLHCTVRVRLIAGGQVVSARIVQGSGNSVFDRSVIAAIYNAAPLPVPHSATKLQYLNPLTFVFTAPKGSSP